MKFDEALKLMRDNGRRVKITGRDDRTFSWEDGNIYCYYRSGSRLLWDDFSIVGAEFELVEEPKPKERLTLCFDGTTCSPELCDDEEIKAGGWMPLTAKCECGKECKIGVDVES